LQALNYDFEYVFHQELTARHGAAKIGMPCRKYKIFGWQDAASDAVRGMRTFDWWNVRNKTPPAALFMRGALQGRLARGC
jgi:hypothetical protein